MGELLDERGSDRVSPSVRYSPLVSQTANSTSEVFLNLMRRTSCGGTYHTGKTTLAAGCTSLSRLQMKLGVGEGWRGGVCVCLCVCVGGSILYM